MAQEKVYSMITDRIISEMEKGIIPWKKPWNTHGLPKNLVSKKVYRGINFFLLSFLEDEYFLTFRQAQQLGGSIKKGAKGIPVIFWKWVEVEDPVSGDKNKIPFLRYYTVFGVSDTDGIAFPLSEKLTFNPIEDAEHIVSGMQDSPEIVHGGNRAFYSKKNDRIHLPAASEFVSSQEYYSTKFHELVHSTGSEQRLNRPELTAYCSFKSYQYSIEELTAEMGAAFLCAQAGIEMATITNSAAYIQGWLDVVKNDKRLLIQAAGKAQIAADYILYGRKKTEGE